MAVDSDEVLSRFLSFPVHSSVSNPTPLARTSVVVMLPCGLVSAWAACLAQVMFAARHSNARAVLLVVRS